MPTVHLDTKMSIYAAAQLSYRLEERNILIQDILAPNMIEMLKYLTAMAGIESPPNLDENYFFLEAR